MTDDSARDVRAALLVLALGAATLCAAAALYAQPADRCEPARDVNAAELLARAADAAGTSLGGARLHVRYADVVSHRYESDRMYAPSLT